MGWRKFGLHAVSLGVVVLGSAAGTPVCAVEDSPSGQNRPVVASGLPVPRFVSLKSDRVNLRSGPGTEYPTSWVFRRAGMPLEVIKEFESWREVRDAEGSTGWVLSSFLSGRRTALVLPWELKQGQPAPQIDVFRGDSDSSRVVAKVEAGVIANVHNCDGRWCQVTIDSVRGYLEQKKLWGIYENEVVK